MASETVMSGLKGHILRGHDGAGGVFGVAEDLVDGLAHLRGGLLQNAADHGGGHFLDDIDRVVHEQLVKDLLQLGVREAADQQLLRFLLHFDKDLGGQLLRQQPVEQGQAFDLQFVHYRGDV